MKREFSIEIEIEMTSKSMFYSIALLMMILVGLVHSEEVITVPLNVLNHEQGTLTSIRYSSDSRNLLTAGLRGMHAILWDVTSGEPIRSYGDGVVSIRSAVFSPDESTILTACSDNAARLWNTESGELLKTYPIPLCNDDGLSTVEFSPSGGRMIVGAYSSQPDCLDRAALVLDSESGELLTSLASWDGRISVAKYSPDEKMFAIVSPSGGTIRLFNSITFTPIAEFNWGSGSNRSFVFMRDSSRLIAAKAPIVSWDMETITLKEELLSKLFEVISIDLSPSERYLLVGGRKAGGVSHGKTELWDYVTKTLIRSFEEQPREVTAVAYSPDGKTIATGDARGNIYLWDVSDLAASGVEQWKAYGR